MLEQVRFDERGLVPCVAQDADSGEVLTLAYANEESLRLTLETSEVHFFSRSRNRIWRKGEESGNVLRLKQLRIDCDGDAVGLCRLRGQHELQEQFAFVTSNAIVRQLKRVLIVRNLRARQGPTPEHTGQRRDDDKRHAAPTDALNDPCCFLCG